MFGRAVKLKVQGRHRVNLQAFEQAIAQKTCGFVQTLFTGIEGFFNELLGKNLESLAQLICS